MSHPGIRKRPDGRFEVDKVVMGTRLRATFTSYRAALVWVTDSESRLRREAVDGRRPDMLFHEAAERFLREKREKEMPSVVTDAYLLKSLLPFVGQLQLWAISDQSFDTFRLDRKNAKKSAKTIHSTLALARAILNAAERKWRTPKSNLPYLERAPRISMPQLSGNQRSPRPITWAQQEQLLSTLPPHMSSMVEFSVQTGARDHVVVNLRWAWIIHLPDLNTFVFRVPKIHVKGRRADQILILNSRAAAIVRQQIGRDPLYVFVWRRERIKNVADEPRMKFAPIRRMSNTAWYSAVTRAGLEGLHIHDLRHTFASRLSNAGVGVEIVQKLLWHGKTTITSHYMTSYVSTLIEKAELVVHKPEREDVPLSALMTDVQIGL